MRDEVGPSGRPTGSRPTNSHDRLPRPRHAPSGPDRVPELGPAAPARVVDASRPTRATVRADAGVRRRSPTRPPRTSPWPRPTRRPVRIAPVTAAGGSRRLRPGGRPADLARRHVGQRAPPAPGRPPSPGRPGNRVDGVGPPARPTCPRPPPPRSRLRRRWPTPRRCSPTRSSATPPTGPFRSRPASTSRT